MLQGKLRWSLQKTYFFGVIKIEEYRDAAENEKNMWRPSKKQKTVIN